MLVASCESSKTPTTPEPTRYTSPDSFRLPEFVNEWSAVESDRGFLLDPGTSTVTPEGTLLTTTGGAFYEYDVDGNQLGVWYAVADGETLGVVHIRFRYGRYYTPAYSRQHGHRLVVFDSERRLIRNTPDDGPSGSTTGFSSLDIDERGNVYKLVFYDELVVKYNPFGYYERQWHTHGTNPSGHNWPGGIAVSADGTVYVADTLNDRILVFDDEGHLLNEWGSRGSGAGEFRWPSAVDTDRWGFLYIADRSNRRVQAFTPDGTFLGEFASVAQASSGDATPIGVAVGEDNLFVTHPGVNLIRRFRFPQN